MCQVYREEVYSPAASEQVYRHFETGDDRSFEPEQSKDEI